MPDLSPNTRKALIISNIPLLFGENNRRNSANRSILKNSVGQTFDEHGGRIAMAAVLIGPKEVLIIVIVTAIVVFVAARGRRRKH